MFVDHIRIFAKAGDGGAGCASFRREKFEPKGGPDGGDGGAGGDVVLQVDPHTDNLTDFFYRSRQKAPNGIQGSSNRRTGRSGKPLVLKVPAGTVVFRAPAPLPGGGEAEEDEGFADDEAFDERTEGSPLADRESDSDSDDLLRSEGLGEMVVDLTEVGQRFVLCHGGKGGRGNVRFKSSTHQSPTEAEPGEVGEEGWFQLELRQIADVGLVGFPNAGKSTLLRALSAAKPKVAAYPFTTLKPLVGVVDFEGYQRATVADIPGLIEGAHANVGLGHEFLRHILRCRLLLFVLDLAGVDGRDPITDLETLRKEVSLYHETLANRPWAIVGNKMDLPEAAEALELLRSRFPKIDVIPVSAEQGAGLEGLLGYLRDRVGRRPE